MELGQKLKAARIEAGLSQRQLCQDIITRNMLSQIENGSARPSMGTLRALCARLGKPMSLFVEEDPSSNLALLTRAQTVPPEEALVLLKGYLGPDPVCDSFYKLLFCRSCLDLAEKALSDGRVPYALTLLEQAQKTDTNGLFARRYALLSFKAQPEQAVAFAALLPSIDEELLLRAQAAFDKEDPSGCLCLLSGASAPTPEHQLLRGKALLALKQYLPAAQVLSALEQTRPVCALLEQCYKEAGDFEKAYHYACLQREL